MNPSNWISITGRYPRNARPTAVPTMPDSAGGVSMTRLAPNSSRRPSVMRNTPPSVPMSSPISTTLSSSRIACRRPALRALPNVICVISGLREGREVGGVLVALALESGVRFGVHPIEDGHRGPGRHAEAGGAHLARHLVGLLLHRREVVLGQLPGRAQVGLQPCDRVAATPPLELLLGPIPLGVVGGGVRTHPVGDGLEVRRSVPGTRVIQR